MSEFTNERLLDLVRYMRFPLYEAGVITDEEYAALVADSESGQRVARIEEWDTLRKRLEAQHEKQH